MDPLLISAASGMKARMESLDMLANNMANSDTAGFKADYEFHTLFQAGVVQGELPLIQRQWTDFAQGQLLPTGNPLQLGLDGPGFFALNSPAGVVYTRNGDFQISTAEQLATPDGYTLRNVRDNGQPLSVDPSRPIEIDRQGVVRQDGAEIGQIELSSAVNPADALGKLGSSYFALMDQGQPLGQALDTQVRQGTLEQSNAPVTDSAVRLVGLMRQFEMLERALQVGNEMNQQAIDRVARVS